MDEILENYRELDITDKTLLQEQINYFRHEYFNALDLWSSIEKKIMKLKEEANSMLTDIYEDTSLTSRDISKKIKTDEDYNSKLYEIEGYERGLKILAEKISFLKSDIRILTNTMYNKF